VQFAAAATRWITQADTSNRTPVVVGGTGFWISALFKPLAHIPELDATRREQLSAYLDTLPREQLHAWCTALDPHITRLGPVQWRRAIEVALFTGHRLSWWHSNASVPDAPVPRPRYLLLDPGPTLATRIAERVDAMLAAGWVAEVEALMATVPPNAIAWRACGYERIRDAVAAGVSISDIRDAIVAETRRYARRQRTWFRTQLTNGPVTRLDPLAPDAAERAAIWWKGADEQ
jgi:tRNA dimethylallyltransferase